MTSATDYHKQFETQGFVVVRQFFSTDELAKIKSIIRIFHQKWLVDNNDFYLDKAVNSAFLTGPKYLDKKQRTELFCFLGSQKLMNLVSLVMPNGVAFMNTQLFFNPHNREQKNYWHRDPQYHLSLEEQKQALSQPDVLHFRIALEDEPGIELIPETHNRWDTQDELNVRLETNGKKNHFPLKSGKAIALDAGDILAFSANMIHRGLYGKNRFALDALFFEPDQMLASFCMDDCLPDNEQLVEIEDSSAFEAVNQLKQAQHLGQH